MYVCLLYVSVSRITEAERTEANRSVVEEFRQQWYKYEPMNRCQNGFCRCYTHQTSNDACAFLFDMVKRYGRAKIFFKLKDDNQKRRKAHFLNVSGFRYILFPQEKH